MEWQIAYDRLPKEVKKLKTEWTASGYELKWDAEQNTSNPELADYFVVYRFENHEKTDISNPAHIIAITREKSILLPYENGKKKYRYVVTAIDRFHNESKKGKSKKVKL